MPRKSVLYPEQKLFEFLGVFKTLFKGEVNRKSYDEYSRQLVRFRFLLEMINEEFRWLHNTPSIDQIIDLIKSDQNPFEKVINPSREHRNLAEALETMDQHWNALWDRTQ